MPPKNSQRNRITRPVAPKGKSSFEHGQNTTQGKQTAEFTWAEWLRPVYLAHCWCYWEVLCTLLGVYWDVLCTLLGVSLQLCAAPSESPSLVWVYHYDSLPRNLLPTYRWQPIWRGSKRASWLDGGGSGLVRAVVSFLECQKNAMWKHSRSHSGIGFHPKSSRARYCWMVAQTDGTPKFCYS